MKFLTITAIGILALSQISCTDYCEQTRKYRITQPYTLGVEQIRKGVATEAAQSLKNPGKIYVKDNFLFINEIKKGIHIIDNTNPAKPQNISFLKIPGVIDMAVKDNILYADSYMDVVALDISDPKAVKEVGRVNEVFQNGLADGITWWYNDQNQTIIDYEWQTVTQKLRSDCGQAGSNIVYPERGVLFDAAKNQTGGTTSPSNTNNGTGTGGSMARFTIYDNFLYTVSQSDLQLFSIKDKTKPTKGAKINLGWGIETIYPYKDKLFIGSNTGMYIYDNKNPEKPERLSIFQHARACDPVVVHNDIAYVTLRSGFCGVAPNRLDVVNISNLSSPYLIKSYNMQNPHGLGIDFPNLFICEGKFGLKSFDASSSTDIKQLQHIEDLNSFDVIPLDGKRLLMIGKDGFYQYDYSNPKSLRLLSKIPVEVAD